MSWSKFVPIIFWSLVVANWTSCQKRYDNSFLIIAVDRLPTDSSLCNAEEDDSRSGLGVFCREAIRYTHSYTTSTRPAAAMGSLLSGQYPFENQLRKSFDRIDSKSVLVSQIAKSQKFRTAFFSGSPNILRKTGLSYYFDTFDDSIASQSNSYIVDLRNQSEQVLNWIENDTTPFLGVIYNSELSQISETETHLNKYEQFNEKLYAFIQDLKAKEVWNKTYVVLVGLSGTNKFHRTGLTHYQNLHSENTLVTTFVKPPRLKGDEGINWKSDLPVNLADIGKTIKCILISCTEDNTNPEKKLFPVLNLSQHWQQNSEINLELANSRTLAVESPSSWSKQIVSWALIQKEYLILQKGFSNYSFELFNTLLDKSELHPISMKESSSLSIPYKSIDYLQSLNKTDLDALDFESEQQLADYNHLYWSNKAAALDLFADNFRFDNPASYFLIKQQFKNIHNATATDKKFSVIKTYIEEIKANNVCYALLTKEKINNDDLKSCNDDIFVQYISFKRAKELGLNADRAKFNYDSTRELYRNEITRLSLNLAGENIWGLYNPNFTLHPLVFLESSF